MCQTILEAALKLDPSNARSNHISQLLSGMGEFDLAFQYADKALAVAGDADTRNFVMTNAGRPRYMAGQYDWVLTKYLVSTPDARLAHFYRSLAFGAKGMFTEALDEAKAYQSRDPGRDAGGVGMIALAYANAGQKNKAREVLVISSSATRAASTLSSTALPRYMKYSAKGAKRFAGSREISTTATDSVRGWSG